MSKKSRGINAERDLIHKFWSKGWASLRAAGSGSSQFPSPDIIASNNIRKLIMEVKLTTEERKYFTKKEIRELKYFADTFGGEPWVGIKFFRIPWKFLTLEDLDESGKSYVVTKQSALTKGFEFEDIIEM